MLSKHREKWTFSYQNINFTTIFWRVIWQYRQKFSISMVFDWATSFQEFITKNSAQVHKCNIVILFKITTKGSRNKQNVHRQGFNKLPYSHSMECNEIKDLHVQLWKNIQGILVSRGITEEQVLWVHLQFFFKNNKMFKCAKTISKGIHKSQQWLLWGVKLQEGVPAERHLPEFIPFNPIWFFHKYIF